MTRAVCLSCGAFKPGALNLCSCGVQPESAEDQARHMLVSDHYLSEDEQLVLSDRIQRGETVEFDEEEVEAYAETVRNTPTVPVWYALLVILLPTALLIAVLFGLAILLRALG